MRDSPNKAGKAAPQFRHSIVLFHSHYPTDMNQIASKDLTQQRLRSGGRVLVDALHIHGVDRVYCVPGESYLNVLDALVGYPNIDVIVTKHEGAAANMAEADGKLTGRPGICFVTRGPGATHGSCGTHIAFQDSSPMILFIGQIPREHRGRESFQEVDYTKMFSPLAKWVAEIDDPARIPEFIVRAFQVATSGRPGPVVLSLPEDVLGATVNVSDTARYQPVAATPSSVDALNLAGMLARASHPIVIVGGANWSEQACADLAQFAKEWNLPVAAAFRRQDLLDNRHDNYVGHMSLGINPKLAERLRNADLVLAVGTRLGDITTDSYTNLAVPRSTQKLIHLHADAAELGRVYQPDLAILTGVNSGVAMLASLDTRCASRLSRLHCPARRARRPRWGGHGTGGGSSEPYPARGCDSHQRRRQLHDLAASLLSVPQAAGKPAVLELRTDVKQITPGMPLD